MDVYDEITHDEFLKRSSTNVDDQYLLCAYLPLSIRTDIPIELSVESLSWQISNNRIIQKVRNMRQLLLKITFDAFLPLLLVINDD